MPPERDPRTIAKRAGIAVGVIAAVLAAVYLAGALYFSSHFFPHTSFGKQDISLKETSELAPLVSSAESGYSCTVEGYGFDLVLTSSDIGLNIDANQLAQEMIDSLNQWAWPLEVFKSRDVGDLMVGVFDQSGFNDLVRQAVEQHNAGATPPKNATIGYSEQLQKVVVVPEQAGTQLQVDAVVKRIDQAVTDMVATVRLSNAELVQPTLLSTEPGLQKVADQASTMVKADMTFTLGGTQVATLGGIELTSWITWDDSYTAKLDDAKVTEWAQAIAQECNTLGSERTYTRPDGKTVTISGGSYGWEIDQEAFLTLVQEGVAQGRQETIDIPCTQEADVFTPGSTRDWGKRYLDIDLAEQHVRFYDENGSLIWESDCISGIPDGVHDTSTGVYYITRKSSPEKLTGYENGEKIYESTVTYWMPFVANVIGLHDADWQPDFGGSMYRNGYGSHGCVNLPPSLAAELYDLIQVNDVVVCHW